MSKEAFFKGKVAIVTGASSGIGRTLSIRLSRLGAKVVLAARNEGKLAGLQKEIQSNGNEAIFVKTDVSRREDVKNLVKEAMDKWGRIDVFVANAGQYIQGYTEDTGEDTFQKSFKVNFFGSFHAVKEILPIMTDQGSGHIAFINSLDSKKGIVGDGPYVAAKSALSGFGDVLRQEVKKSGIHVLTVYPGRVDTPMIKELEVPRISAKISVDKVVKATLTGIFKKKPVVVVPKTYYSLGALNSLFPRMTDWFYRMFQIEGTRKH